jgi:hypothetical protein
MSGFKYIYGKRVLNNISSSSPVWRATDFIYVPHTKGDLLSALARMDYFLKWDNLSGETEGFDPANAKWNIKILKLKSENDELHLVGVDIPDIYRDTIYLFRQHLTPHYDILLPKGTATKSLQDLIVKYGGRRYTDILTLNENSVYPRKEFALELIRDYRQYHPFEKAMMEQWLNTLRLSLAKFSQYQVKNLTEELTLANTLKPFQLLSLYTGYFTKNNFSWTFQASGIIYLHITIEIGSKKITCYDYIPGENDDLNILIFIQNGTLYTRVNDLERSSTAIDFTNEFSTEQFKHLTCTGYAETFQLCDQQADLCTEDLATEDT